MADDRRFRVCVYSPRWATPEPVCSARPGASIATVLDDMMQMSRAPLTSSRWGGAAPKLAVGDVVSIRDRTKKKMRWYRVVTLPRSGYPSGWATRLAGRKR